MNTCRKVLQIYENVSVNQLINLSVNQSALWEFEGNSFFLKIHTNCPSSFYKTMQSSQQLLFLFLWVKNNLLNSFTDATALTKIATPMNHLTSTTPISQHRLALTSTSRPYPSCLLFVAIRLIKHCSRRKLLTVSLAFSLAYCVDSCTGSW